jgi:hypothetical protein
MHQYQSRARVSSWARRPAPGEHREAEKSSSRNALPMFGVACTAAMHNMGIVAWFGIGKSLLALLLLGRTGLARCRVWMEESMERSTRVTRIRVGVRTGGRWISTCVWIGSYVSGCTSYCWHPLHPLSGSLSLMPLLIPPLPPSPDPQHCFLHHCVCKQTNPLCCQNSSSQPSSRGDTPGGSSSHSRSSHSTSHLRTALQARSFSPPCCCRPLLQCCSLLPMSKQLPLPSRSPLPPAKFICDSGPHYHFECITLLKCKTRKALTDAPAVSSTAEVHSSFCLGISTTLNSSLHTEESQLAIPLQSDLIELRKLDCLPR